MTVDIANLEKARLYINIEGDKLMEYYKVAQNGQILLNAEKWTRIGLQTQPGTKVNAQFLHQEESHKVGSFNKYDPGLVHNNSYKGYTDTIKALVNDMHNSNEKFQEMHLSIDGKIFIASQQPINSIEHYTVVTVDQMKDLIKEALLNRVCVKTAEDGTREQRSIVKELDLNFGRSHYSDPHQQFEQKQEALNLYAKNGIEFAPVNVR